MQAAGAGAIKKLAELANGDPWLVHRGRYLDVTFLVEIGDTPFLLTIRRGRVEGIECSPKVMPRWNFALRASEQAWSTFWTATPPPGFHDLVAMIKMRALRLEGDQYPFMANLRYFKDLMTLPRMKAGTAP